MEIVFLRMEWISDTQSQCHLEVEGIIRTMQTLNTITVIQTRSHPILEH
jgi:hypothetical protein